MSRSPVVALRCKICPGRVFPSREALVQHSRESPVHPFCGDCRPGFAFESVEKLLEHNAQHHPTFLCRKCHQRFFTQSSLDDHYRGKASAIHPNCDRCGKGFFDETKLREHFKEAHPRTTCFCGATIFDDEMQQHYLRSASHPNCVVCTEGFKDDLARNEHGLEKHADCICVPCQQQFISVAELNKHFTVSFNHPKCMDRLLGCKRGFLNEHELRQHLLDEPSHYTPTSFNARLIDTPKPLPMPMPMQIPGAPRIAPCALPAPNADVSHGWKNVKNHIVAPRPCTPGGHFGAGAAGTWGYHHPAPTASVRSQVHTAAGGAPYNNNNNNNGTGPRPSNAAPRFNQHSRSSLDSIHAWIAPPGSSSSGSPSLSPSSACSSSRSQVVTPAGGPMVVGAARFGFGGDFRGPPVVAQKN